MTPINSIRLVLDAAKAIIEVDTEVDSESKTTPRPGQSRVEFLNEELRRLRNRRHRLSRLTRFCLVFGSLCIVGSLVVSFAPFGLLPNTLRMLPWVLAMYGVVFFVLPILRPARPYDTDILALESELDLATTTEIAPEQRAEKLFKHHQFELQKYYDQTLKHSRWIFLVGVLCIFLGFVTVGATFYFVVRPPGNAAFQEKVLVSILGTVAGILANFIAVIYLRMFSEILKSVTDFHNRLVGTHNLYFANFMSTKISERDRDAVIAEIIKGLAKSSP